MFALVDWKRAGFVTAVAAAVLAVLPQLTGSFAVHVLVTSLYYTILAASWNLLAGFTGQFSLAQQGFAAVGA